MKKILTLNSKIIKIAGGIISVISEAILGNFIRYDNNDGNTNQIILGDDYCLIWE
jgi:hypothetical protein